MNTDSELLGVRCYGIDLAEDRALVVAERSAGKTGAATRFPAGEEGVSAVRERIVRDAARPRICIRSCNAAALAIALGFAPLPRAEVTLVAPHAIESSARSGRDPSPTGPEERAQRLARLAERLT